MKSILRIESLIDGLKSLDKKVLLEIANAIYYRKGFYVEEDFVSTNKKYYNAEVKNWILVHRTLWKPLTDG